MTANGGVGRPEGGRSDVSGLNGSGRTKEGGVTCVPVGGRLAGGRSGAPGRDGSATTGVGVPGVTGDGTPEVGPGLGGLVTGIAGGGFG